MIFDTKVPARIYLLAITNLGLSATSFALTIIVWHDTYLSYFRAGIGITGLVISITGFVAFFKHISTNYLLVHGALSGLFLPAIFGFMFTLHSYKDDESGDLTIINNLTMLLIFVVIIDTMTSFLLYGFAPQQHNLEFAKSGSVAPSGFVYGCSYQARPSQASIVTGKSRPSVVFRLSDSSDRLSPSRSSDSKRMAPIPPVDVGMGIGRPGPRPSICGPVKFSQAARRGSSFI